MGGHHHEGFTAPVIDHADAWHRHSAEEGVPQGEHTAIANPMAIGVTLVVMILTVAGLIVILTVYFDSMVRAEKQSKIEVVSNSDFSQYRAGQEAQLQQYQWVDEPAGVVAQPIDKAKARVIERYSAKK